MAQIGGVADPRTSRRSAMQMVGGSDGPRGSSGPQGGPELPGRFTSRYSERPTWVASQRDVGGTWVPNGNRRQGSSMDDRCPSPGGPTRRPTHGRLEAPSPASTTRV
jgi:hypothetical protein